MNVHAPFRFAPIAENVYFPKWGPLVSHDVPFRDGLSGEVAIEIEATQPLLVGGVRRKATATHEGEVWPFTAADGSYAIPGSTVQGMVRSIMEMASLGRLAPLGKLGDLVFDRRFGFRDLRSPTGRKFYQERMATNAGGTVTQHAKSGWLVKTRDATTGTQDIRIIPCDYARIQFGELRALKAIPGPDGWNLRNNAQERYSWFTGTPGPTPALNRVVHLEPKKPHPHVGGSIRINYQLAFSKGGAGREATPGTVVFTGKPQPGVGPRAKKMEFVLHSPNRVGASAGGTAAPLPVTQDVWRDFELIHEERPGRAENPNWSYWKAEFEAGAPVPVFYLTDGANVVTFGTAFMFKTALPLSTHQMLANSSVDHVAEPEDRRLDLPSLVFGAVADESGAKGLKRRASFDLARATALPTPVLHSIPRAILLDPKPGYFPSYVRQPGDQVNGTLDDSRSAFANFAYDAGARAAERRNPKLAGTKVWPARNRVSTEVRPPHLDNQRAIQVTLNALPIGTKFRTVLRFHNLRPAELGAIVWALSFGNAAAWTAGGTVQWRHRMGMGKPYGLGEVAIRMLVETLNIERNDNAMPAPLIPEVVGAFEREMSGAVPNWRNLPQLRTLFAVADPGKGAAMPETAFDYMILNPGVLDEFTNAKTNGTFLPEYMIAEVVPELRVGARIRMNNIATEGVIEQIFAHQDPLRVECSVLMDGQTRSRRYRRTLFQVIG
jgi:CRISPR-associated protein (TIGR03986 family)